MKSVLVFFFTILIAFHSLAQNGTISGKAIDNVTTKPVEFATVTLLNVKDSSMVKSAFTDTSGVFSLENLPVGKFIITISSVEYKKYFKGPLEISESQNSIQMGEIKMSNDEKILSEVVIKGEKMAVERVGTNIILNVASSSLYKTSTNALDILKKAPGLQVKGDGAILIRNSVSPTLFINGKPSNLEGAEITNYLNALTPDQIESIEIIPNPSGQYDATYKAIIDLKLKRDKNLGWNGNISQTITKNTYWSPNTQVSLSYKTQKLAISLRSGFYNQRRLYTNEDFQNLRLGGTLNSKTEIPLDRKIYSNLATIEYDLTKNDKLGVQLTLNKQNETNNALSVVNLTSKEDIENKFNTYNFQHNKNTRYSINPYFEHKSKQLDWNLMYTFSSFKTNDNQDIKNVLLANNQWFGQKLGHQVKNIDTHVAQADFTNKLKNGKLNYGFKSAFTTTNNSIKYDTLNQNTGIYIPNASQSNDFVYKEYINAAYLNYSFTYKKWQFEAGIRGENTQTNAHLITNDSTVKRHYFYLLPSFSANYAKNANTNIGMSFSSRLSRPDFSVLNPFQFYINQFSYVVGNPFLLASVNHTLMFSYSYKDLNISFSASKDVNSISQVPFYDPNTNISYFKHVNIKSNTSEGFDISYNLSPKKWWTIQTNLGLYLIQSQTPYFDKIYKTNSSLAYMQGSQIFKLGKGYTLDLGYEYTSKLASNMFYLKSTSKVGFGIQKSFFADKLSTKLRFDDLFYGYIPKAEFMYKEIYDWKNYQKYDTRAVTLQVIYNFGKSTYKSKQKNSTDEEKRAN